MKEEPPAEPKVEEAIPEPPIEPPQSTELIDKANEAADRLERANKEHEKLIAKQEALQVEKTLGGKADASVPPAEETPEEYAKKVMANDTETD